MERDEKNPNPRERCLVKKLPTMDEMMAARVRIAAQADYDISGTFRLGNPNADKLAILTGLVYESEFGALAAFAFLMEHPDLIAPDAQVALVLARPEEKPVTANLNRLPLATSTWNPHIWEHVRAAGLRKAFAQLYPLGAIDLQDNNQPANANGWVIDVSDDCDLLARSLTSNIRVSGLAFSQVNATNTSPFTTLFNCPSVELLSWSVDKPGAKKAIIRNTFLALKALGCLAPSVQAQQFRTAQQQYETIGFIPSTSEGAFVLQEYLQPFVQVKKGTGLGTRNGMSLLMPMDGYLCFGPTDTLVKPGRTDPLFYIVREAPAVQPVPLLDEYDE